MLLFAALFAWRRLLREAPRALRSRPRQVYIGRQLDEGAGRLLSSFALSSRPYVGRTALPPDESFVMANLARVGEGHLVLDPFCGAGCPSPRAD